MDISAPDKHFTLVSGAKLWPIESQLIISVFVSLRYKQNKGAYLFIRGWPVGFYGYIGINILVLPVYIFIDIGVWSFVGLVLLLSVGFLKHRAPQSIWRKLTVGTAVFIILSPTIPAGWKVLHDAFEKRRYETWLITNMEEVKQGLTLKGCYEHLVSSATAAGTYDFEVETTATIRIPHHYVIETKFINGMLAQTILSTEQNTGDYPLQFKFPSVDESGHPLIRQAGPYPITIHLSLANINGSILHEDDIAYAERELNISGDGISVTCQTPPYQLVDLYPSGQP